MPDSSLMLDLCDALEISVNELLSGEMIDMKEYNPKAEQQLLEMVKEREKKDRELLHLEVFIGILVTVILLSCVFAASFIQLAAWTRIVLIFAGCVPFIVGVVYAVRLEQIAGFYECQCCHHKYVPTYSQMFLAMHSGRTRYMKCPECGKKSWQKKIISK